MDLIFATNNKNKVEEIQAAIGNKINIRTLSDVGIDIDIGEPYDTLEENALEKARTIHELTRANWFSEDTGLEVASLNGEPGVKSARYAGDEKNFHNNIVKLLKKLEGEVNRNAWFRT